jgi:ribokinase
MTAAGDRAPRVAVVGSVNYDVAVRSDRFPDAGETLSGLGSSLSPGGKGANQAVQAALLEAHVTFVARVGDDAFAAASLASLEDAGVDTTHVVADADTPTGIAVVWLDRGGENRIVIAANANAGLCAADVDAAADAIGRSAALVVQFEVPDPVVVRAAEVAVEHGVPLILNPAPPRPIPAAVLAETAWLVANRGEAEAITGIHPCDESSLSLAAAAIRKRGPRGVVITLGEGGAFVDDGVSPVLIPAVAVDRVVDTTAAGDAFVAAFAVGLAGGSEPAAAAALGAAAGAVAVARPGAQSSLGTRAEVEGTLGLRSSA